MIQKSLILLMMTATLVGSLALGCAPAPANGPGEPGQPDEKIVWTLDTYFPPPPGIYVSRSVQSFVDRVNARLDGRFEIRPVYGSTLGVPGPDVAVALEQGVFECGFTAMPYLAGDIPVLGIAGLPALIKDNYEALAAHAVLASYYQTELDRRGVVLVGSPWLFPKQGLYSTTPINSVADFSGMRFRVSSPEQTMMMDALGATTVSLNMPEVYTALERGMLDAIIGSTATAMSVSAWEVLDYGIDVAFSAADSGFLVGKTAWEALPDDIKVVLQQEAMFTANEQNWKSFAEEENDWATLGARGIERLTPPPGFFDELAVVGAPIWDSWSQQRGGVAAEALTDVRALLDR